MRTDQLRSDRGEVGSIYLTRSEIASRVAELGAELARDYAELDPLLIAPLKSSVVFLADLTRELPIAHALDVVDTGLTLHFLCRSFALRDPASLAAVTLLDRPYRRLVDDIPLRYIGFTVPDELFAGYGLGLDERWRALADLHVVVPARLPTATTEAA